MQSTKLLIDKETAQMSNESLYNSWPKVDDRSLVWEMLDDRESQHWRDCLEYVQKLVYTRAKNISEEQREDIAQQVMIRIDKHLNNFKFQCMLRTWIYRIIRSCIVEAYRKSQYQEKHTAHLSDAYDGDRYNKSIIPDPISLTPEAKFIRQEEVQTVWNLLHEYVNSHANTERNGKILEMFFVEERSYEDIAKIVGCSAPVVGYVIRAAKTYVRKKWNLQQ